MNESAMPIRRSRLALFVFAILVGCSQAPAPPAPLAGASMGGPFTLTDQNGHRLSDRDLAGKYRLVYFGYTFCPDVCPIDMHVIGAGLHRFETQDPAHAARVQPIFISVDPERDTPAVLRQFVAAFHPRMIGLTGSPAEIAQVAREYRIFYQRGEASAGGGYMVNHTRMAVLYGPDGLPIAMIPHDQGPEGVAAELARRVQ